MIACGCEVCKSKDLKDNRLRSSILVKSATTTIVIDTTPDFRYQMLRIDNRKLDAVVFTHPHKDHTGGMDDIRPYNYFQGTPVHVYANALTEESLRREYYYAFSEKRLAGLPDIIFHSIDETPFTIGDIGIIPIKVWHYKMPVYGYRIGNFTYITDANKIDESEKEKIRGSEVLVLNSLRKEKHLSHFTLDEAIALSQELGVRQTYFTHISHQLGLHDAINRELPAGISLAFDGLTIEMK